MSSFPRGVRGSVSVGLKAVEVVNLETGSVDRIDADTVVFTGGWVPDHELARRMKVATVSATGALRTDGWGHTSRPGVLAAGNLVHPGETAGIAAMGGRAAGRRLAENLTLGLRPTATGVAMTVAPPLSSVVPAVVDPADPPSRLLVRTNVFTGRRLVVARQGGRELGRARLRHSVPHRSLGVPGRVLARMTSDGGPVEFTLE